MRKPMLVVSGVVMCSVVLLAVTEQRLNVKPGVWQVEYNVKYSGLPPQMQAMVDRMSAQQKAAMGIEAPKAYKMCLKEKDLNKGWTQGDNNCRWQVVKSTSTDLELHGTSCKAGKNEGAESALDLKIHVIDSEHVQATMHGTESGNGLNAAIDGDYTGKWLSASCPADLR